MKTNVRFILTILLITSIVNIGSTTLWAGNLMGEFKFSKRAPTGALIYFSEDHSLKKSGNIDQKNTAFVHPFAVGPKGSTVTFFNSDTINHNIYANDKETKVSFDIGLAAPGSQFEKEISWDEEKFVRISCKIHPKMRAWVTSLSSQYYTSLAFKRKQKKARFEIKNVPDNLTKIKIWLPGYPVFVAELKSGESQTIDLVRKKKKRGSLTLTR